MAGITRTVHPSSTFAWKPLDQMIPDMHFGPPPGSNGDAAHADPPMGLAFIDPDGETHVFVFNEDGRKKLLEALTGGIVLPGGKLQ
jgi:hypothetical protein